jgi:23S rRNA pseudouridine2605 synthase
VEVRLQKFLAEAGVGSRRQCEALVRNGRVSVDGKIVTKPGTKIVASRQTAAVDGRPVGAPQKKVYLALNKPLGYVCTSRDPHAQKIARELLPRNMARVYTIGRLDKDTEGLLLFTNDGNFSLRLTHPRYKIPKTYLVESEGDIKNDVFERLLRGVRSEGELLRAEKISKIRKQRDITEFHITICQGKKRQIRRMLATVGHPVRRLIRLSIGSVHLGNLKSGHWRFLDENEISKLKNTADKIC